MRRCTERLARSCFEALRATDKAMAMTMATSSRLDSEVEGGLRLQ
jgi:hypothetical protein